MATFAPTTCNVCGSVLGEPLYVSTNGRSLTSLCRIYEGDTIVRPCGLCAHLQSETIENIDQYYASEYDILLDSEEEDQIYEIRDGTPVYRTDHQLLDLLAKVEMAPGSRVLDFGCAKSSMMRAVACRRNDVDIHLFDVSDRYIPFWKQFLAPSNWSVGVIPKKWTSSFDIVTSFFSFEHLTKPAESIRSIFRLLKPGGVFYCVVPHVLTNVGDLIVVDHVNHFSKPSLYRLFSNGGLEVCDIDAAAHNGALVAIGRRPSVRDSRKVRNDSISPASVLAESAKIARFWATAGNRVTAFEKSSSEREMSVYGAGFYGAFIAASLREPSRIVCHIDQNRYLQGKSMNGKPIVAPDELPPQVRQVLVGLNPLHARKIIAEIAAFKNRELRFFYL